MTAPQPAMRESMWSKEVADLQIAWDSTSLKTLQECAFKYYLSIVCGYRGKRGSPNLLFGILMHQALETYHICRAKGADHDEGCREAVKFTMLHGFSLNALAPGNERTRGALTRAVVWYLDRYKDDPAETYILSNGKPAVELSFRVELGMSSPDGDPYLWCGHIDRVVNFSGDVYVSDVKTTAYSLSDKWFKGFTPNNQFSGYVFASKLIMPEAPVNKVLIDGIELKVNFNRYMRDFANRPDAILDEWHENTLSWITLADMNARTGIWPRNFESCDKYGGCPFRDVCSAVPSVRHIHLNSDYIVDHWDPLISREA